MSDRLVSGGATGATERVPAEAHPAATIVLVRPAPGGREVLLLRRPPNSAFAPDAWVFPGGRVDAADRDFDHARLADGPEPVQWAATLTLDDPREASAYAVAALREAWEETGILLAAAGDRPPGCDEARQELLAGTRTLAHYLEAAHLRLATGRLRYVGHRLTPVWLSRRFDTRFFLAEVASETRCELVGGELVDFRWTRPERALRAAGTGEVRLLPPTLDTLQRLAQGEL